MNNKLSEFLFSKRRFIQEYFNSLYEPESKDPQKLTTKDLVNLFIYSQ